MPDATLVVHEIYRSIQGESSFAGQPCTFVRLTGCNLRCSWCDTPQAFHQGTRLRLDDIVDNVTSYDTSLTEVTGGEPLLQQATLLLMERLCNQGKQVLLETSGERDISMVDARVHRIVDFKAPASGECHRNRWENVAHLNLQDEIKLVLQNQEDYEWAKAMLAKHDLARRVKHVWLSPVHNVMPADVLVQWLLSDKLPVRLQLQIHKYIWGADARGV